MGAPAIPTPAERAATLAEARRLLMAVECDEEAVDTRTFRLAQDLAAIHDREQPSCAIVVARRFVDDVPAVRISMLTATVDHEEARRIAAAILRAADAAESGQ